MKRSSSEKIVQRLQEFLEKRGEEVLEIARKTVTEEQERIECKEVKEALNYFIDEYRLDEARPALPSIICEAVGGKLEITKSVAVPLILISGAIDIHDDIINGSRSKYGKPTIYGKYGRDIALLVGDALLFKGLLLLLKTENLSKEKRSTVPAIKGKITMMSQKEQKTLGQEKIIERVQRMMEERGSKPLEMARKEILRGDIKSIQVQEALNYFVRKWWEKIRLYMLGPTLISLACEAVGGNSETTITIAASLVLMTTGIRIHDDIIDDSKTKNAYPTIFGKFGTDTAIVAGRALIVKGLKLLHEASEKEVPTEKITRISDIIRKSFFEFGSAEALELNLRGNLDIPPQKYMRIIKMKASIYEASTRVGVIIGGGIEEEIEAFSRYGRILGMLSTIRGDFIDMFEADELHHRRANECLPLPILYALQNPEAKKKIIHILEKERLTKKDVDTLIDVVYNTKQVESLKEKMQNLAEEANLLLASLVQSELIEALKLFVSATLQGL